MERFIQSALREWAYACTYHHSTERTAALPAWLYVAPASIRLGNLGLLFVR